MWTFITSLWKAITSVRRRRTVFKKVEEKEMPTGDQYVNLALKRFLSQNRMSANFLDYCVDMTRDGISRFFPASGLFTFPVAITPDFGVPDFDLSPDPIEGVDNQGRVLKLEGASRLQGIPFENTTGDEYWLGLSYIEVPDGVYANPRTGLPEYDKWREEVGVRNEPDAGSIADGGGYITARVNDLFIDGASHNGRDVTIWLINPVSIDESVAIETVSVVYSAGNNNITTGGDLGQSTISTTNTDYQVACIGVSIRNAGATPAGDPFTGNYCVLGYIVGGTPGSDDEGAQVDLSGGGSHTLQKAYDGLSGGGSGRIITINGGAPSTSEKAVELIKSSSGPRYNDIFDSSLRIRTDMPSGLPGVGYEYDRAIDITARYNNGNLITGRIGIADFTGGDKLRIEETVNVSGATVTFTRGGFLDLDLSGNVGQINTTYDYVELSGSALAHDGVYRIFAKTSSTLTIREPDGTIPVLAGEVGITARIYRSLIRMGGGSTSAFFLHGLNDFYEDEASSPAGTNGQIISILVPPTTDDGDLVFRIYRDADADFQIYANGDVDISNDLTVEDDLFVTDGNIQVSNGNLTVVSGTIAATVGTISAGDDLSAVNEVYAGRDAIATRHIQTTGGNVIVDTGNVNVDIGNVNVTTGSVYADNGTVRGNLIHYAVAKVFTVVIPSSAFHPDFWSGSGEWKRNGLSGSGGGAGIDYYWIKNNTLINDTLTAEVRLPDGAEITRVRVKWECAYHATTPAAFAMMRVDVFGAAGSAPTAVDVALAASTKTTWEIVEATLDPSYVTIDNSDYGYTLEVAMDGINDKFAGVEIRYEIQNLVMG